MNNFIIIFLLSTYMTQAQDMSRCLEEPTSCSPRISCDLIAEVENCEGFLPEMYNFYLDETILTIAARKGKCDVVQRLVDCGLNLENSAEAGQALVYAAGEGDLSMLQILLQNRAPVNYQCTLLGTPLLYAISRCGRSDERKRCVRLLLQYNADVNIASGHSKSTSLHAAALSGDDEIVDALCELGADKKAITWRGLPLHLARSSKIVKKLLVPGQLEARDCNNNTALIASVHRIGLEGVKALVEAGADVNAKGGYQRTALHKAAECFDVDVVNYLLSQGACADAQDYWGEMPLQYAINHFFRIRDFEYRKRCESEAQKVVTLLLEKLDKSQLSEKLERRCRELFLGENSWTR